jgi:hypothetical protein
MYHTLAFEDASRAADFIAEITAHPEHLPRPQCQSLQVFGILTHGSRADPRAQRHRFMLPTKPKRPITSNILKSLIDLFPDTIVELSLHFWNVLSLPKKVLETIGRLKNLRALRLGHELQERAQAPRERDPMLFPFYHDSDDEEFHEEIRQHNQRIAFEGMLGHDNFDNERAPDDMNPVDSKIDHDCLKSLIKATRKLTSLNLTDLNPVCLATKPMKLELACHQFLAITQLEISLEGESAFRLLDLSIILKRTLKVLALHDHWGGWVDTHGAKLVPVFENLGENLEGLFITNKSFLSPIIKFKFPKLQVFKTVFWKGSIAEFLQNPILSSSPIEVLALQSEFIDTSKEQKFRVNPFANLPLLRRLILYEANPTYVLPPAYLHACKSQGAELIYIGHLDSSNVSLFMVSRTCFFPLCLLP